jgi:hypothetical protein
VPEGALAAQVASGSVASGTCTLLTTHVVLNVVQVSRDPHGRCDHECDESPRRTTAPGRAPPATARPPTARPPRHRDAFVAERIAAVLQPKRTVSPPPDRPQRVRFALVTVTQLSQPPRARPYP